MDAYQVVNCLISQPKHIVGTQKNVSMRGLFLARNYRLKQMIKKIFLKKISSKSVFI